MRLGCARYVAAVWIAGMGLSAVPLEAQTALRENTLRQIGEILADKESRTPAQKKVGSQLLYAAKMARGERLTNSIRALPAMTKYLPARGQRVRANIEGVISPALEAAVTGVGGQIEAVLPEFEVIRAWVPLAACERLAARDDVRSIMPSYPGRTSSQSRQPVAQKAKPARKFSRIPPALLSPSPGVQPPQDTGGRVGHGADLVQALGFDGTGLKVAAMSDGDSSLSNLVTAGYLPDVTVVPGQDGTGTEGVALLEVVHDLAPGAQLFFACGCDYYQMATNIRTLVDTYHVDIIVDDISFDAEPMFQDGVVAQAVTYALSKGVLLFAGSNNDSNLDSGIPGEWEGDFNDGGTYTYKSLTYHIHQYKPGVFANKVYQAPTYQAAWMNLQWANSWTCPTDDYDLLIVDPDSGDVAIAATDTQSCGNHPQEVFMGSASGYAIYVVKKAGSADVAMHLGTGGGVLDYATAGATWSHHAARDTVTVASIDVKSTVTPAKTGGGGIFTGGSANPVEIGSSDGPRAMFFDASGNPLNPNAANPKTFAGGGATYLDKVDISAADCVHTVVPGFDPFCGTSAAAPHAGAVAALVKSADPYLTPAHVVAVMKNTALLITANPDQPNGVARRTQGAGIAMANRAVAALHPSITIATNPPGLGFTISGASCSPGSYTAPQTLPMLADAPCSLSLAAATVTAGAGAQYVFTGWSDGASTSARAFTAPLTASTVTANYKLQYLLTLTASPASGGTVQGTPSSSDGYYDAGSVVNIAATANDGFVFDSFSGGLSGTTTPQNVTVSAATTVIANFAPPGTAVLLTVSPASALQGQQSRSVAIAGQATHFVQGTSTASFGAGISVVSLTVNSATSATALLNIGAAAAAGARDVAVTTGSEVVTLPAAFTVSPVAAALGIAKSHTGAFTQGATGTWNIAVSNTAAGGSTSGVLTVTDTLPSGYTLNGYSGTDWTCSGAGVVTCTNSDAVAGGAGYPVLHLVANVPAASAVSVNNSAVASGGGAPVSATSAVDTVTVIQTPASIAVASGNNQSVVLGGTFGSPLAAAVTDAGGVAVAGVTVTFTAPASGAGGKFGSSLTATAVTNASGLATSPSFTANSIAGPYTVTATISGMPMAANFTLTNLAPTTTLESTAVTVARAAGTGTVLLDVNPSTGTWTAVSNASAWLHVVSGSESGTGNATVHFSYDANGDGAARTGTLTVGAATFTVTQAGTSYLAAAGAATLVQGPTTFGPSGLALDGQGNLYVSDYDGNQIVKWNGATGAITTMVPSTAGLNHPNGIAVDAQGNIYIADYWNGAIKKMSGLNGQVTTLSTPGLAGPYSVALDGQGNLYIADIDAAKIRKWSPTAGMSVVVSSGLSQPAGIAMDGQGTLYIADLGLNSVLRWSSGAGLSTLASGLNAPEAVAADGQGNVYITDSGNNMIKRWSAASGQVTTLLSSWSSLPDGIAVDPLGNFYFSDYHNHAAKTVRYAYVGPASTSVGNGVGTGSLLPVLPAATGLTGSFAPSNDASSWLTVGTIGNGVINFSFTANTATTARTGHISVLGQSLAVTQAAASTPCDIDGSGVTTTADVASMVTEVLSPSTASHDLNHDGFYTVVDIQIVVNSAMGKGCGAS